MANNIWTARASTLAIGFVIAGGAPLEALAQTDIGALTVVSRQVKPKKAKTAHARAPRAAAAARATSGTAGGSRGAARVAAAAPVVAAPAASQLPVFASSAVGSKAPPGSAPALAPSQAPLDAIEPTSIVSDKVIRDMIQPSADLNEIIKYTPGAVATANNGLIGDTNKGGWRGFSDGQYNVTFDGIPFGDENNPSHHSASYFPSGFIGRATVDRGPGPGLADGLCDLRRHAGDPLARALRQIRRQHPELLRQLQHFRDQRDLAVRPRQDDGRARSDTIFAF